VTRNSRYRVIVTYQVEAFDANTAARLVSMKTGAPLAQGYLDFGTDEHLPDAHIVSARTVWIEAPGHDEEWP
jgi:hypothetical protein